jgi:hypothetical protein
MLQQQHRCVNHMHAASRTTHLVRVLQAVCRLKLLAAAKGCGLQEVQQGPQLLEAVLQRRAGDEQLVLEVPARKLLQAHSSITTPASDGIHVFCSTLSGRCWQRMQKCGSPHQQ